MSIVPTWTDVISALLDVGSAVNGAVTAAGGPLRIVGVAAAAVACMAAGDTVWTRVRTVSALRDQCPTCRSLTCTDTCPDTDRDTCPDVSGRDPAGGPQ